MLSEQASALGKLAETHLLASAAWQVPNTQFVLGPRPKVQPPPAAGTHAPAPSHTPSQALDWKVGRHAAPLLAGEFTQAPLKQRFAHAASPRLELVPHVAPFIPVTPAALSAVHVAVAVPVGEHTPWHSSSGPAPSGSQGKPTVHQLHAPVIAS